MPYKLLILLEKKQTIEFCYGAGPILYWKPAGAKTVMNVMQNSPEFPCESGLGNIGPTVSLSGLIQAQG